MSAARRHGSRRILGTAGGWWQAAARMIALVLTLALTLPTAGLAEDLAFHAHRGGHGAVELPTYTVAEAGHQAADPGLVCHAHCGCHVTASPCEAGLTPPVPSARPRYARTAEAASSVFPDRLPRPPRA
ncbi:hypothetical protein ACFQE0_21620 [Methylobacterium komagatae]|uniref:DUF2946 domain-containing protein n=1 Tax=Methylobacterium komagatae TaxID=374425 RepID=A0ABW2BNC5_9HYPH